MKANFWINGIVLAWAFAAAPVTPAGTYTFQQGTDSYAGAKDVTLDHPSTPSTGQAYLRIQFDQVSLEDEAHNALIKFEGIDSLSGLVVQSAMIELKFQNVNLSWGEAIIDIHAVRKDWIDPDPVNDDPNWILYTDVDEWQTPGAQGINDRGYIDSFSMGVRTPPFNQYSGTYTFDLPPKLVQSWIDHPENNYGIILTMKPSAATDITFASSDHATVADRPILTVETINCTGPMLADVAGPTYGPFECDCVVDLYDYMVMAEDWLYNEYSPADTNSDGIVDLSDFVEFQKSWLDSNVGGGE